VVLPVATEVDVAVVSKDKAVVRTLAVRVVAVLKARASRQRLASNHNFLLHLGVRWG
jgi:hypothetical protein